MMGDNAMNRIHRIHSKIGQTPIAATSRSCDFLKILCIFDEAKKNVGDPKLLGFDYFFPSCSGTSYCRNMTTRQP